MKNEHRSRRDAGRWARFRIPWPRRMFAVHFLTAALVATMLASPAVANHIDKGEGHGPPQGPVGGPPSVTVTVTEQPVVLGPNDFTDEDDCRIHYEFVIDIPKPLQQQLYTRDLRWTTSIPDHAVNNIGSNHEVGSEIDGFEWGPTIGWTNNGDVLGLVITVRDVTDGEPGEFLADVNADPVTSSCDPR